MATWQTPPTKSTGQNISISDWNALANNETFLYQKPYGLYYNTVAQAVANGNTTKIPLGGTTASGYGFSLSGGSIIVPLTGVYQVSFACVISTVSGSGANSFYSLAYHQSAAFAKGNTAPTYSTSAPVSAGSALVLCNAGDTLSLWLANNGGTGNTVTTVTNLLTYMHAVFIGSN